MNQDHKTEDNQLEGLEYTKKSECKTTLDHLESQHSDSSLFDLSSDNTKYELKKGLQSRHIQLIALGGCIGTGLFVGTSFTLNKCGPIPLLISFLIISTFVYPIMCSLAEMICFLPQQGSVHELTTRYVDPSLGFAVGWNYAYAYAMLVATEMTAAATVVEYWTDKVPSAVWTAIFLCVVVALNFSAVKYYGEAEFWFASLKIICIVVLLIVSIVIVLGGAPTHDRLGFRYWKKPGPFAYHITDGNAGRFLDIWTAVIKSSFAFILSPELIGLACVEAHDTRRNIEKASKRFIYRVIFFYVSSAFMIGLILSRNSPELQKALSEGKETAAAPPFVQGIKNAGIGVLDHVVNFAILTSAWSAGNSFMYAASRSILALAQQGDAPKFLARINKSGVPYAAVGVCTLVGCLAFLNVAESSANVFQWLSNICTISGFIGWATIGISYIRFSKAIKHNGLRDRLPYKGPFQPYGAYFFLIVTIVLILGNGYAVFIDGHWDIKDFLAAYITIPIFALLYIGHKIYFRSSKLCIPVNRIDVTTGLIEAEEQARLSEKPEPKGALNKFLAWLF